jgi:hypothetical protein
MDILNLREDASTPPLVVVRLGSSTLDDSALVRSTAECRDRRGL